LRTPHRAGNSRRGITPLEICCSAISSTPSPTARACILRDEGPADTIRAPLEEEIRIRLSLLGVAGYHELDKTYSARRARP
jgi:hypothetical protein